MNQNDLPYRIALTLLHGIGPKRASLMISRLGSAQAVFTMSLRRIHIETGIHLDLLRTMKREEALIQAEKHYTYIENHQIQAHFYLDRTYPRRLKQCPDAPLLLYSKGRFETNPIKSIAIVGTRAATGYGKQLVQDLIGSLSGQEIQVISGMAYGIDICAHQLCLEHNIQTVGILGHGLDRIYPSVHKRTADRMLDNGGIMTEFLPGTNPDRENFPMRNRIVAGMSDAIVVVESKITGGSLITADMGLDYNRDVFAYPGNVGQVHSEGCNRLIKEMKAQLITSPEDILLQMGWQNDPKFPSAQRVCFTDLAPEDQLICELLQENPELHIDVLALRSKLPLSLLNVRLFHLEMSGIVRTLPGKKYSMI